MWDNLDEKRGINKKVRMVERLQRRGVVGGHSKTKEKTTVDQGRV
jgi:hypothetical protein